MIILVLVHVRVATASTVLDIDVAVLQVGVRDNQVLDYDMLPVPLQMVC